MDSNKRKQKNRLKIYAIVPFLLFAKLSFAEQVEVTADNFFADEIKLESVLTGNVNIKKGSYDTLDANKATIYFDKEKHPIKYVASGNAKFKVLINEKHYDGKGDVLTYEPQKEIYTLNGNAYLHEAETNKEVFGDNIIVNQINGTYEVQSQRNADSKDKKPAKLIFQVEDKKK